MQAQANLKKVNNKRITYLRVTLFLFFALNPVVFVTNFGTSSNLGCGIFMF